MLNVWESDMLIVHEIACDNVTFSKQTCIWLWKLTSLSVYKLVSPMQAKNIGQIKNKLTTSGLY